MKCPKCGFVSYPGLDHCKKCGHKYVNAQQKEALSLFSSISFGSASSQSSPEEPPVPPPEARSNEPETAEAGLAASEPILSSDETIAEPAGPPSEAEQPWQKEISERVEHYRRRRARLQGDDSPENLDLDFDARAEPEEPVLVEDSGVKPPSEESGLDVELDEPLPSQAHDARLDAVSLEELETRRDLPDSPDTAADAIPLENPGGQDGPVEIVVGPPQTPVSSEGEAEAVWGVPLAPLGRRFLAGVADALILLLGAGIFALIYWRAGGHFTHGLINITVAGFISVFFVSVYFGLFIAVTAATPGLLWMGLEVRNLDGAEPTPLETFWRTFGYLVSISALMLGFIWAWVDGEGLTWHDRISGTFITFVPSQAETGTHSSRGVLQLD